MPGLGNSKQPITKMRITGGIARSIRLKSPKGILFDQAQTHREDFASLGTRVGHCVFLDLFAGTGACGLEALSRGASGGCCPNLIEEPQSASMKTLGMYLKQ